MCSDMNSSRLTGHAPAPVPVLTPPHTLIARVLLAHVLLGHVPLGHVSLGPLPIALPSPAVGAPPFFLAGRPAYYYWGAPKVSERVYVTEPNVNITLRICLSIPCSVCE
jgi:hypothetical protein